MCNRYASFHFKDDFATFRLHPADKIQVVFHRGAKVKDNSTQGMDIDDPSGLLHWVAKDRCVATFSDMQDIRSKEGALVEVVKQWIAKV